MNSNIAPQSAQDDVVIRLKCPECSGGLNLRRAHLGISGKCVHCKTPITAVEEAEVITVKRSGDILAPEPKSTPAMAAESAPVEGASTHFVPPLPTSAALPSPPPPSADEKPASAWGFPGRGDTLGDFAAAPPSSAGKGSASAPTGFSEIEVPVGDAPAPMEGFNIPESSAEEVVPAAPPLASGAGVLSEKPATEFSFSEKPTVELSAGLVAEEESPETTSPPAPEDASGLFETKGDFASSPLFSSAGNELSAGWGAKVPDQNHASISPFSTGSAEPDPGFAEALFREKAKEDTGKIEPRSPFAGFDENEDSPLASEALFGSSPIGAKPAEPEKKVILDGDGRPLREMTPEERDRFAQDVMHFSDARKGSSWLKRLAKLVATIVVLGGIGFGAYVFLPQEQIEVAKAKIIDWLEPGSVLMQYLPFEIGSSEDGEKGLNIKALEGLSNLSGQMDQYLNAAEDNLNSTLGEGAEGYQREKPIDTPELPGMPKIPGVKMPELPGAVPSDVAE